MKRNDGLFAAAAACALSACGGGGGGSVASTPVPPVAPPVATNSTITDLAANQNFVNDDASSSLAFDLTTKTTISGTAKLAPLTVTYDAGSKSYTLSESNGTDAFSAADVQSSANGETRYSKASGAGHDYLTLVTTPYSSNTANKYVGLGFWQRNVSAGTRQDTFFDVFTYGFPTAAGATPRTGDGKFAVDVFGLASIPGAEPRVFQGRGSFNIDFAAGVFATNTNLTETGLLSGSSVVGGGIQLQGAGTLTGGTSAFVGNVLYGGQSGTIGGQLSGRFYGPAAEELGASFAGSTSDGATFTGGFTGQRDSSVPSVNLTLLNLTGPQLFYTQEALLDYTSFDAGSGGTPYARTTTMVSQFNQQNSDTFTYGPGRSDLPGGSFTATSLVASTDPNFKTYKKTFNGQDVTLELFRPGPANTELALTYASFGRWSSSAKNGVVTNSDKVNFVYGLETPAGLLSARTGSAHYNGVAYGAAANETTDAHWDVHGTSTFDVNFSNQRYSGALSLGGTTVGGSSQVDFGTFTFANQLSATTAESQASLLQNGTNVGMLSSRFFGPNGDEIGGPFTLNVVDPGGVGRAAIAGIAIAKGP